MATIFGPLDSLVNGTANALISAQIPAKTATAVNGAVTSWFNLVGDLLGVAADITKPAPPSPPSP
jgi:hypothetical protein